MKTAPQWQPGSRRVGIRRVRRASGLAGRTRGIMLLEALVYCAVLFLVTGMAVMAFHRTLDHTRQLRRVTEDISHALEAGERWRAEVRRAEQPPRMFEVMGLQALHLPRGEGEVVYIFDGRSVQRRSSTNAPWATVVPRVKHSRFVCDPRERVTAWRWELEFEPGRPSATMRPRFTFTAVPTNEPSR
ncbi:MAG: hypothetical protein FJ387_20230 [Verrucomicrobia bacterium]|nr:hypothetical protein [Verrucomicrobiota bacterium]